MTNLLLDLDNVVVDYNTSFGKHLCEIFGIDETKRETLFPAPTHYSFVESGWYGLGSEETFRRLHAVSVENGLFLDATPLPGAIENLNKLAGEGIRIHVVTSRFVRHYQHGRVVADTAKFLDMHSVPYSMLTFTDNKGAIFGDIAIDDSPKNIEAYQARGIPVIVYAQKYNEQYEGDPDILLRSDNWDEIARVISDFNFESSH